MQTTAKIYPNGGENPTVKYSDSTKANIGICFSGGGSRALTCAWGQMLGLETLGLMQKARYLSSVSGGTWASSIYTFLPQHISDKELLGSYYPPQNLSLSNEAGKFDIGTFQSNYALGHAPQSMDLDILIEEAGKFLLEHCLSSNDYKWLWGYLVSHHVLKPFGLQSQGKTPWSSSKSFSLSSNYVNAHFPSTAPSKLYLINNPNRPFIVMNNNLMEFVGSNVIQLPNQVTAISGGVRGETPTQGIVGGGSVESYGVSSQIEQDRATHSPVDIGIDQPYSLIDIASTSSAFFAQFIAQELVKQVQDDEKKKHLTKRIRGGVHQETIEKLLNKLETDIEDEEEKILHSIESHLEQIVLGDSFISKIIPEYNYWSLGEPTTNRVIKYTDGGTLENLGILGMLAQSDEGERSEPIKIVAFANGSIPLIKKGENIIAGSQAAPLFGIDFDEDSGEYRPFSDEQKDPHSQHFKSTSLIQLFDNSQDQFSKLVKGLYEANSQEGINTTPAFYEMELSTVKNTLANITAGRKVKLLYIQNAKMLKWQDALTDENLKAQIKKGQSKDAGVFEGFKDFPYYSTFTKIGLKPQESNALSQMWAWALYEDTDLSKAIQKFMG